MWFSIELAEKGLITGGAIRFRVIWVITHGPALVLEIVRLKCGLSVDQGIRQSTVTTGLMAKLV